jgi:hypothetical protein
MKGLTLLDTSRVHDLAHQLWEKQGRPKGHELDHWLEAERRLREEQQVSDVADKPKKEKRAEDRKKNRRRADLTAAAGLSRDWESV